MPNNFESFNNNNETYNTEPTVPQVPKELAHKFGATAYADHREAEGAMENGASDTPSEDMDMMFQEKVVETPEIPQQEAQEDPTVAVLHELEGVEWHEHPTQNTNVASETTESHIGNGEEEATHESLVRRILEKAKKSRASKAVLGVGLAATMAFSLAACIGNNQSSSSESASVEAEAATLVGEQANGVTYDYSHYADREGKESANAYDYSLADCYGDREATAQGIMDVAKRTPEALASYAYTILTPDEKAELNLTGKTMVEIDDKMSNDLNGGVLQRQIIEKLDNALNDKKTIFKFYKENDFETSSYVYFVDSNKDGVYSPDELHIGYANVQRNGAPQVDIMRPVNSNRPLASGTTSSSGEWETVSYQVTDINLSCGGQVNYGEGEFPPGVPYIDPNDPNPTPEVPTQPTPEAPTQPTTEWGKSGDPHGGPDVVPSDKVDPDAEVTKEQNENTNKGNQGYIDDNKATPGSGSENNGTNSNGYASSNIIAPGANTNEERLDGGENQGGSQINGENAYNRPEQNNQGQQIDDLGNESQEQAQDEGIKPGEDNYSNAKEENPDNW